jgi:CxxC motif-containing protein (DUF1111 family)
LIETIPDCAILAEERWQARRSVVAGRALRLSDGRIGKFGWKAQTASLSEFVRAACANELGLGNPDNPQPTPLAKPDYVAPGLDLTAEQCDQITAFVASLPRPVQKLPADRPAQAQVDTGERLFSEIGCAYCHKPDLGPVQRFYSDLLLHRMGLQLASSGGSYSGRRFVVQSPADEEWRTPPLWGVADSPPYLHDGRAATLEQAILMHGGQAATTTERFRQLTAEDQGRLIAFLKSLRAP